LDNPQIYDLFKSTIQKEVDAAVHQRLEGVRNRMAIVWTTVGTIMAILIAAVPTIGWNWLDDRIRTAAETAVEEKVDTAAGTAVEERIDNAVNAAIDEQAARFDAQVATLNFHVLRIQIEEAFSADAAESIIGTIGALYAERRDAESRDKLVFAVESAVDSFASADRPDLMFRLEEEASELFHASDSVLQTMVQAQGRRLLGDAGAPESWLNETGSMRAAYESYRFYADKGRVAGYPEFYTAYELLLGHLGGRPNEELKNLIADAESLNEPDQIHFLAIMSNLATGEWTKRPNAESERVTRNVRTFLCEFEQESSIIEIIAAAAELQCP
jgi:hypothetical protein